MSLAGDDNTIVVCAANIKELFAGRRRVQNQVSLGAAAEG